MIRRLGLIGRRKIGRELISFLASWVGKNMSDYDRINSYKELIVWQKAMDLVVEVYKLTDHYPKVESIH